MVAERLSRERVSAIYTSDLCRAKETASIIAAHHPLVRLTITPLLRECGFGEWEGRTYDEIAANEEIHLRRWYDDPWCVSPPGGECLQEMEQRISRWLEAVAVCYGSGDTLVAVAHAGPIRLFHAKWVKRNPRALWDFPCRTVECWRFAEAETDGRKSRGTRHDAMCRDCFSFRDAIFHYRCVYHLRKYGVEVTGEFIVLDLKRS